LIAAALLLLASSAIAQPLRDEQAAVIYVTVYGMAGLPLPDRAPRLEFNSTEELRQMVGCSSCKPLGFVRADGVVHMHRDLDFSKPYPVSALAHEFVHYLQLRARGDIPQDCAAWRALELHAFDVQIRMLIALHADDDDLQRARLSRSQYSCKGDK
jgi:hypothetical protein